MDTATSSSDAAVNVTGNSPSPVDGRSASELCTWRPRCPRCGSRAVGRCDELLVGYEERATATHECGHCATRFRVVPPTQQCLQAYRGPEVHR
jgi:hypothetical protein